MPRIPTYPELTTAAGDDLLVIEDTSAGATKKITVGNLTGIPEPGWTVGITTPSTVTANGNRIYTCVFNSVNLTTVLSPGMFLRTTRTAAAPTQCTDLEAGSTQYYSKSSPNKLTFTDDFVVSAWVKMESYVYSPVASRYNGTSGWRSGVTTTGQFELVGFNASAANYSLVTSYATVPLGKWVHVTAQLDMSAFTATTTTSYVMFDGVDVAASVSRGGTNPTALIQPAADLQIGKDNTTNYFDGKMAQVAIYSAKVTQANILASISQGLSGSETSLASAYSFSNSINDLNTSTPNNLTANGAAVATNADSPFGRQADASISSTLDYAEILTSAFSTNTTLVVRVPEGNTIPTSGGVSALAYSPEAYPYGFPGISKILGEAYTVTSFSNAGTAAQIPGLSCPVNIPSGRKVKVTVWSSRNYNATANAQTITSIWDGVVASGTQLVTALTQNAGSGTVVFGGITASVIITPTAGAHTFNAGLACAGGGTAIFEPAGTGFLGNYITVELI